MMFYLEVSMFLGRHKLNNMSVWKAILRGIDVYNIILYIGELLFKKILYCLQIMAIKKFRVEIIILIYFGKLIVFVLTLRI